MIITLFTVYGEREEMREQIYEEFPEGNHKFVEIVDYYGDGRYLFWKRWNEAFAEIKKIDYKEHDLFVFMPDDFLGMQWEEIEKWHEFFEGKPYAMNIINDGRAGFFTGIMPVDKGDYIMSGMVDCGFFCNLEAFEAINEGMSVIRVSPDSSGVGRELSNRFLKHRIPMYTPKKSLAFHGFHESLMHPEERKKNPLISK